MARYNGILPVNKESGLSSHDVVNRLRRVTGQKKIGHTGTLDPMATGLLLTCFGRATPLSQFMTDWDKSYRAEITLGKISDTFDADGKISEKGIVPDLSVIILQEILERFTGRIRQTVPSHSAVKVRGRRLYQRARKGEKFERPEREIIISSIRLLDWNRPRMTIAIDSSKGTYIRSLADDIGAEVGCGGYLSALERTGVGPFGLNDAVSLAEVASLHESNSLEMAFRPIERVLEFPVISFRNGAAEGIQHGVELTSEDIVELKGDFVDGDLISMADEQGRILAIAKSKCDASKVTDKPKNCFYSYVRVLI